MLSGLFSLRVFEFFSSVSVLVRVKLLSLTFHVTLVRLSVVLLAGLRESWSFVVVTCSSLVLVFGFIPSFSTSQLFVWEVIFGISLRRVGGPTEPDGLSPILFGGSCTFSNLPVSVGPFTIIVVFVWSYLVFLGSLFSFFDVYV